MEYGCSFGCLLGSTVSGGYWNGLSAQPQQGDYCFSLCDFHQHVSSPRADHQLRTGAVYFTKYGTACDVWSNLFVEAYWDQCANFEKRAKHDAKGMVRGGCDRWGE